jgi:1-phosphatidylinositol phosphodiesterase
MEKSVKIVIPSWATTPPTPPRWLSPRPRRLPILLTIAVLLAMSLFYILMSIAPCMVGLRCYHGYSSPFSFDIDKSHHPDWMSRLPDAANITSLSIPGTHDTMTYSLRDDIQLQCQNYNLTMQMRAGLRYFDIRARLRDDKLRIYHAAGDTGFDLEDVLKAMFDFLDENPSETIIMRLKEEGSPIGDNNSMSFAEAFEYYRHLSPITSVGAGRHLFLYDRTSPIPTLGHLRSKIFLLQQFKSDTPYGLEWEGTQMKLEDLWIIPDVYHLADKWTAIRDALEEAALAELDNSLLYLAHVSASVGVLPIEAAAGPANRTVVGMNDMTGQWLQDYLDADGAARTGIVILDFPGKKVVDAVLKWNSWLESK